MSVSAKGGRELAFIYQKREKSYASKLLLWQMPDAMRSIFKNWGEEAKKQKSQSMFIPSFHLFDISIKILFFERQKEKLVTPAVKIKNEHMKK